MFFGLTASRLERSVTATPVNSIVFPPGRLVTRIVARAGVLPNSKCLRVDVVHLARRLVRHVRVDEHDVTEVQAGGGQRLFHVVERQLHLRTRVRRHLAGRHVGARESRQVQPVARDHSRRPRQVLRISRRTMGLLRVRSRNATALISTAMSVGQLVDAEHRARRRRLGKELLPDAVHHVVVRHIVQVHLAVHDMLHRQPCGFDDGLHVLLMSAAPALRSSPEVCRSASRPP
jgi:hypothetical protein